ncbi:MAG: four helix bundle protein, partial [Candidatus Nealsonbacteria bacterium CG_4_10_14_3_um_filter_36_16]
EGFSRQGYKEKLQFYYMALGSLTESQNQLLIAKDLNYLEQIEFNKIAKQSISVHKLLNGFVAKTKTFVK